MFALRPKCGMGNCELNFKSGIVNRHLLVPKVCDFLNMWDGFLKKILKEEMFAAMQEVWHLPCKSCNIVTFQHRITVMDVQPIQQRLYSD